jgi:hypothetical protein
MIEAKAFRTFIRINSLFKSERLSTNNKPTLHKPLIRNIITYVCPAWEFVTIIYWNCSACKTRFSAPLEIFQGAHRFAFCTWLLNCAYWQQTFTSDCDSGKRQTRPLVRQSAPHQQTWNCLTVKEISGLKPQMDALFQDRLADWPSVVT